jgi:hypothetical protein
MIEPALIHGRLHTTRATGLQSPHVVPSAAMALDPSSRARLTRHTRERFEGDGLFARIARTVCDAECLPRKELFEAWEVARRVRRRLRGGRVLDLAAGHGLLAMILLILDDTSPSALCIDKTQPLSFERLLAAMTAGWPRLADRITYETRDLREVRAAEGDLVASVHACGPLSDAIIDVALTARARLALLPCCHDLRACDTGGLEQWMDGPVAVDAVRARRVEAAGYETLATTIPAKITPQNRLLLAWPRQ